MTQKISGSLKSNICERSLNPRLAFNEGGKPSCREDGGGGVRKIFCPVIYFCTLTQQGPRNGA
jgi:hypothetical protein